jgi:MFS family permease
MDEEKKTFGISRNVFLLGAVSFLNDLSSEMIAPIMPVYLTSVLDIGKVVSGAVMGMVESLSSLFKVFFGRLSDYFRKRKFFIATGYLLSTLSKGALAFTHSWWDFLALRIADRTGKGIRTAPRDALIAESSEKGKSGRSFGFHRMLDTLGAVAGPLIAIAILAYLKNYPVTVSYRLIFMFSAVPGFIGVLIILLFVRERAKEFRRDIKRTSALKSKKIRIFLLIVALGALGRYSYAFTLWKAEELGFSIILGLGFYTIFNIVYSFLAYPAGYYSDKIGKKNLISFGFGLASLASFIFAFADSFMLLLVAFILYGAYTSIEDTVPRAYMADLAAEFEKGTVIGAYHTIFGIFVFPASLIMGLLWENYGLFYGFIYAGVVNILAMVLMLLIRS